MKQKNLCKNCAMHWEVRNHLGECEEGCNIGCRSWIDGRYKINCYFPRFMKLLYWMFLDWKADRTWKRMYRKRRKEKNVSN